MNDHNPIDKFLTENRISQETWERADISWEILSAIAEDHKKQSAHLEDAAELIAKRIQKCSAVHSVRWRVKKTDHLLEKIVRKRADGNSKYSEITAENYFTVVSDLVGVRALHLFKTDCFVIDKTIREAWTLDENPAVYIRDGDSERLRDQFRDAGFEVKEHPAGYRSVHYVTRSTPMKRDVLAEIQVRTIFEEGWSEIDHSVRYPNFSDSKLVEYFLQIFNRLAGSADDMGGFVLGLVADLKELEDQILAIKEEKNSTLQQMDKLLSQLEKVKEQDKVSQDSVSRLKAEVAKLRDENSRLGLMERGLRDSTVGLGDFQGIDQIRRGLLDVEAVEQAKRGLGLRAALDAKGALEQLKKIELYNAHKNIVDSITSWESEGLKVPKK